MDHRSPSDARPAQPQAQAQALVLALAATSRALDPAPLAEGPVILVVDRDVPRSLELQEMLTGGGYVSVTRASGPASALALAVMRRPDLILLDVADGEPASVEPLKQLRSAESLRTTPILALAATASPAGRLRIFEAGANGILVEPLVAQELLARVRTALDFKRSADQLANDDPLTGLPNRSRFTRELEDAVSRAAKSDRPLALLHLNVDRFRQINDSLGHLAGDDVLRTVAARLARVARSSALAGRCGTPQLARLGGDEFALMLPDVEGPEVADLAAQVLLAAVGEPFEHEGQTLVVSASVGIAMFPRDAEEDATLLINAGAATRHAKDSGRNTARVYRADLHGPSIERLMLESDLHHAAERGQLELHYQPKVHLATGRIEGAEALLRWRHPVKGLLQPGQFVPMAEENGRIVEIGEWVIGEACRQLALWRNEHGLRPRLSINVARHSLMRGDLVGTVRQSLIQHGIEPSQLTLELTESMLLDRVDVTVRRLQELRALGVQLSIDDFGTGYASMSYLKHFPAHELKIDRAFVKGTPEDTTDMAIVRALVVLGHSLSMRVVAEGVETEPQRQAMSDLGVDAYQGYLFSRPVPPKEFLTRWQHQCEAPTRPASL